MQKRKSKQKIKQEMQSGSSDIKLRTCWVDKIFGGFFFSKREAKFVFWSLMQMTFCLCICYNFVVFRHSGKLLFLKDHSFYIFGGLRGQNKTHCHIFMLGFSRFLKAHLHATADFKRIFFVRNQLYPGLLFFLHLL